VMSRGAVLLALGRGEQDQGHVRIIDAQ
jgi:hypothetical protein